MIKKKNLNVYDSIFNDIDDRALESGDNNDIEEGSDIEGSIIDEEDGDLTDEEPIDEEGDYQSDEELSKDIDKEASTMAEEVTPEEKKVEEDLAKGGNLGEGEDVKEDQSKDPISE